MHYENPILPGFHPDPSICRVGEDFYLAASTFAFFPGIALFHSKDLVNWEELPHAVSFRNPIDLTGCGEQGGIWAATIRYCEKTGTFYLCSFAENRGNFILHAKRPEGPWSDPVWVPCGGIDPSLFFENGRCWICVNAFAGRETPAIVLAEVSPDTGELLSPLLEIWHGTGGGWLEAPHIYHVGDWYYLLAAEGGTGFGHMESAARSRTLSGPYESDPMNPILTNRNDTSKQLQCTGHGDLVEDGKGNWWMVHLGCRRGSLPLSQLGRETCLTPVHWQDGWPVIRDSMARIHEEGPLSAAQKEERMLSDSFTDPAWLPFWEFLRNPDPLQYRRGGGRLCLFPRQDAPVMVLTAQPDFSFRMETEVEIPEETGPEAGIVLWNTAEFACFFGIRRTKGGELELFLRRRMDDVTTEKTEVIAERVSLTLVLSGIPGSYHFSSPETGSSFRVPAWMFSGSVLPRAFTGTMAGLYAAGNAGACRFDSFILTSQREDKHV